ncbi:hypothetical protein ER308_01820 [Egibacter rhizosphaerae]|uniref:Uncharacterized protein n=1 Tax=Egibacter rhizosphaerae TaxID=1670831 RepID=A0A411YB73_9ACTN|nr:hypothetical protein ER308_01820 [Egibacter rhizosphaerae]
MALRWEWRSVAIVVVAATALLVTMALDHPTLDSPVFGTGVLLGLLIAALAWQAPWAYAQHLVIGAVIAVASLLSLGALIDVPLPPATPALAEPIHPLAGYQPLLVPVWLVLAGTVEYVRLLTRGPRGAVGGEV